MKTRLAFLLDVMCKATGYLPEYPWELGLQKSRTPEVQYGWQAPTTISSSLIFQFPTYLEPGVNRYLINWQLGACFQIYRELEEDQGLTSSLSVLAWPWMFRVKKWNHSCYLRTNLLKTLNLSSRYLSRGSLSKERSRSAVDPKTSWEKKAVLFWRPKLLNCRLYFKKCIDGLYMLNCSPKWSL